MDGEIGLVLFRALAIICGVVLCAVTLVSIACGYSDDDPFPWFFGFCFHGCPTAVCWLLRAYHHIDAVAEVRVLTVAFLGIVCFNAVRLMLCPLGVEDLWLDATTAPVVLMVWGCFLQHLQDQTRVDNLVVNTSFVNLSHPVLWPVVVSICGVLVRVCWDAQMSGNLLRTWVISLGSLLILHLMTDIHHSMIREAQQLVAQRKFQECLLAQAFDATMSVSLMPAEASSSSSAKVGESTVAAAKVVRVSRSSESLDQLMGQPMESKPLRGAISDESLAQLTELMRIAEENAWNSEKTSGPLLPALITCYDSHDMEFDCELRAVVQAPTGQAKVGGLLCGLRRAGESRPRMFKAEGVFPAEVLGSQRGDPGEKHASPTSSPCAASSDVGPLERLKGTIWNMLVCQKEGEQFEHGAQRPLQTRGADVQHIVWETLCQFPDACALWCTRGDLRIFKMSPSASEVLPCQVGHHVSTCLAHARHAVLLRQVVKIAESRVEANPARFGHFYVHPCLRLSFRFSWTVAETAMKTLLVSAEGGCELQQPSVIFLLQLPMLHFASESVSEMRMASSSGVTSSSRTALQPVREWPETSPEAPVQTLLQNPQSSSASSSWCLSEGGGLSAKRRLRGRGSSHTDSHRAIDDDALGRFGSHSS